MTSFEQEEMNSKMGEVNLMQKVSEDLIMGFNRHKDVKGALSLAQIPI